MKKNVVVAGVLGGLVVLVWLTFSNAMLPIKSRLIRNTVPLEAQLEIHAALKNNITEPGTYSCPYVGWHEEASFPDYRDQPVYSITYDGFTHGSAGSLADFVPIPVPFIVAIIAAWMLSMTSRNILSRYPRRVLFVAVIGLIIALYEDVLQMSFGPTPKSYLVFLAINNVITWTLAGLVIAWRVRPVADKTVYKE
ncbi:MAG: hypothetical protein JSU65_11280 [Candidatus Zixiibacteriota bacterium]|nr:MAG: hypothetical protein JSU65_11280 [candidate division Zixibacteria bacterium]